MSFYTFGSGTLVATPFGPNAPANPTPLQLGTMQECSVELNASQKELYGKLQFPVAIARTAGKVALKAKFASIYAKVLNDLFFGASVTTGQKIAQIDESHAGAASIAITPPASGTYDSDLGVRDGVSGNQLVKVASGPAVGQYSEATGTYTFNASDTTSAKLISYTYAVTGGAASNVTNKPMGSMPVFSVWLANNQYGNNMVLNFPNVIASKLTLSMKNEDFMIPDFDMAAFSDAAGNIFYEYLDQ